MNVAILIWVVLNKTTFGYELKAVGLNKSAARYAGIPNFRLEKDVLNAEIDILREMGVEFKCGVEVGRDVTIEQLRAQGYKGFYVAIGAQKSARLGVAGEELTGVYGGVDFLRAVNLGEQPAVGKRCAVIGGGNVAMDVCRSAVRLGADETYVRSNSAHL